jgi:hypothetical protein
MLICRSAVDGKVLGFAHDLEIATEMAQTNDWRNWYAIVDATPSYDPRDKRGGLLVQ